ncbi:MAG: PTS sugar transporter subunit IIA, partial [Bacillota bacterium]
MMHVGIDTVELKGKGFKALVNEEDHVKKGDRLLKVNLKKVTKSGKSVITPLIITNMDMVKTMTSETGRVKTGDPVLTIELNQEE